MTYLVTIKKPGMRLSYPAIGNAFDLHAAAIDKFGLCVISIMVRK